MDGLVFWTHRVMRQGCRERVHLEQLEEMWCEFRDFAPKGFRRKFQVEFHQRWWEMYLTLGLLHLGVNIKTSPADEGPDLCVDINGKRLWIEAVAPRVGTTSDRVPEPTVNGVSDYPKRECLLRLSQQLNAKRNIFEKYIQKAIIQPEDVCIIAISACNLNQYGSLLDFPCSAPLALLAGAGDMVVTRNSSQDTYFKQQKTINRDSGSPIDFMMYERDDFKIVSGILYSNNDPLNAPSRPESTFSLFLNPRAYYHVPCDIYMKMETWTEEKRKVETIWKKLVRALEP